MLRKRKPSKYAGPKQLGKSKHLRPGERRILVSYTTVQPQGEEENPDYDTGWVDEEGSVIKIDRHDIADGVTIAGKAAKFLKYDGANEPSSSHFDRHIWYSTGYEPNYRTGEETEKSYHLKGFTEAEERQIFKLITGK